jgi:hypothetical protein
VVTIGDVPYKVISIHVLKVVHGFTPSSVYRIFG